MYDTLKNLISKPLSAPLKIGALSALLAMAGFASAAQADTTNRALQVSPVPGIFVGGVGLLCAGMDRKFLVLTRDRKKMGIAVFINDDVSYQFLQLAQTTLEEYTYLESDLSVSVNRKDLSTVIAKPNQTSARFTCAVSSVSDLHKDAEQFLRERLRENKI